MRRKSAATIARIEPRPESSCMREGKGMQRGQKMIGDACHEQSGQYGHEDEQCTGSRSQKHEEFKSNFAGIVNQERLVHFI